MLSFCNGRPPCKSDICFSLKREEKIEKRKRNSIVIHLVQFGKLFFYIILICSILSLFLWVFLMGFLYRMRMFVSVSIEWPMQPRPSCVSPS